MSHYDARHHQAINQPYNTQIYFKTAHIPQQQPQIDTQYEEEVEEEYQVDDRKQTHSPCVNETPSVAINQEDPTLNSPTQIHDIQASHFSLSISKESRTDVAQRSRNMMSPLIGFPVTCAIVNLLQRGW